MSYQIKWEPYGAVKYFTGVVTSRDLLESEDTLRRHPDFGSFRYVISVYLTALDFRFKDSDREALTAKRVESHLQNPRVRYAVVTQDASIAAQVAQSIHSGQALHETAVFGDYAQAAVWANQQSRGSAAASAAAPATRASVASPLDPQGPESTLASPPQISQHEQRRLAALRDLQILDTAPDPSFDDVVFIASQICQTPIALISLVDESRQWFKAKVGLGFNETPRSQSFCAQAIQTPDTLMEVHDASVDPRFADNAMVTGKENVRFYAGVPLVTEDGKAIGTVCVIDQKPRILDAGQTQALRALARLVMSRLMMTRKLAALQAAQRQTQ